MCFHQVFILFGFSSLFGAVGSFLACIVLLLTHACKLQVGVIGDDLIN